MIIFEYIHFEVFEVLIAERTAMMTVDCLLDTMSTVYMSTTCDVAIGDRVQTDCTLKFVL